MRVLYAVHAVQHIQMASVLSRFADVRTIGPSFLKPDIVLCDESVDFRSTLPLLFNFIRKDVRALLGDFDVLAVSDLYFTLYNLLYSNSSCKNIFIAYDGLLNYMVGLPLSKRAFINDLGKKLIFSLVGLKYTVRKNCLYGHDILESRLIYRNLTFKLLPLYYIVSRVEMKGIKNDFVLYVSIANRMLNIKIYKAYELRVLEYLKSKYSIPIKVLYRPHIDQGYINNDYLLDRSLMCQSEFLSGEDIIFNLNPSIICGDVSSTLVNAKLINKESKVFSVGLKEYCALFEPEMFDKYSKALQGCGIDVIGLDLSNEDVKC